MYYLLMGHGIAEELNGEKKAPHLREELTHEEFLSSFNYYNLYASPNRTLPGKSLAFITPWNNKGYDYAKEFAKKFTHISPVWAQIKVDTENRYLVQGLHDHDEAWILAVRTANPDINIVPRLLFDGWSGENFDKLFKNPENIKRLVDAFLPDYKRLEYDGIVLEIVSQHSGTSQRALIDFLKILSRYFRTNGMEFILVVPPPVYQGGYTGRMNKEIFDGLREHVDFFSVMTYDYSNQMMPGPNSPVNWIEECVKRIVPSDEDTEGRSKLLVGINFYGNDFLPNLQSGGPILASDFVKILQTHKPEFEWLLPAAEHLVRYTDNNGQPHTVYFPTPLSIARRISLLHQLKVGVSVWELGQGFRSFLNYF
ncbi:Chitinase domain-containing protein 1 [Cichlidogyrus casuarinus]|uniref:Chitinase domain-containing protein 1 n=1 Tax=Cichlidogyrus casuarinus TaxID=1844966 RepID=A0ABD2QAM4_9PLAT